MLPQRMTVPGPIVGRTPAPQASRDWASLAAASDRDDVREQIHHGIRAGTIRAKPWPGDPERVRIIPVHVNDG